MKLASTVVMPPSHRDHLQSTFDDHPSLAASLEDFESSSETQSSPTLQIPSQHSGFRSGVTDFDSEPESSDSAGPWSPPAWRKPASGWFQNNPRLGTASMAEPYRSPARSRDSSPLHGFPHAPNPEEPDVMLPAEVPLPGSPTKHRSPSPSPEPQEDCGQDAAGDTNEDMQHVNNCRITNIIRSLQFNRNALLTSHCIQTSDSPYVLRFNKEPLPSKQHKDFGNTLQNQRLH